MFKSPKRKRPACFRIAEKEMKATFGLGVALTTSIDFFFKQCARTYVALETEF